MDGGEGSDNLYIYGYYGRTSNDTLIGGAGDDTLDSYDIGGAVILDGGSDVDTLGVGFGDVSGALSMVFDDPSKTTGTITAGASVVRFIDIENLNITGTAFDEIITGGNGNDTLYSGGGNDTLNGGDGVDYLYVRNNNATVTANGEEGDDHLYSNSDYNTGDTIFNGGTGNDSLNLVDVYSSGNNSFDGGEGSDYLSISGYGSTGNNTLLGGAGDDTLTSYNFGGAVTLDGGSDVDTLRVGFGYASVALTMVFADLTNKAGTITTAHQCGQNS